MKNKLFITILIIFLMSTPSFADDTSIAMTHFSNYVSAANSYNPKLLRYYDSNAKIIRQVVKPNGQTVNATTTMSVYAKQMQISQNVAKMRNYKNKYTNVTATKLPNGDIKVSALRQPMQDKDRLKTYQIWHKKPSGAWVIVEEMMQTKQQVFLQYADKKQ